MKLIKRICFFTILLSLFTMSAESQNNIKKYDAAWKKVEEFSKKNLPKSALAEVKKIYDMAKKDGSAGSPQDAQLIKSLVYMTGLQAENREDNEVFSIAEMEKEFLTSFFSCKEF